MQQIRIVAEQDDRTRCTAYLRGIIDLEFLAIMRFRRIGKLCIQDDFIQYIGLDALIEVLIDQINQRQQSIDALSFLSGDKGNRRIIKIHKLFADLLGDIGHLL